MHPALITLAAHLPAVAWAGAAPDSAIDALLSGERLPVRRGGEDWDTGRLVTELARTLRAIAAGTAAGPPRFAAAELLAVIPVSPGDVSAAPAHPELARAVGRSLGAVLVRDPSTGSALLASLGDDDAARTWRLDAFSDVPMPPQPLSVPHATARLSAAVDDAAEVIARAQRVRGAVPAAELPELPDLADILLPPGMTNREVGLLDRADSIERIRTMANVAEAARGAPAEQQPVLWGLQSAVDAARRAALASYAQRQLDTAVLSGRVG